jgi:hypothetical protein
LRNTNAGSRLNSREEDDEKVGIYSIGNERNKEIHFGTGDIKVSSGWLKDDRSVGVLVLRQHDEPKPIGHLEDHFPHDEVEEGQAPVRMTFNKVESVDVLIERLEKVKEYMISGREDLMKRNQNFVQIPMPDLSIMTNEQLKIRADMLEKTFADAFGDDDDEEGNDL